MSNKCYSAFYASVQDKKTLKTFDVFHRVAIRYPQAAQIWLEKLQQISKANIQEIFNQINTGPISTITVEFAKHILAFNQNRLLHLRKLLQ